MAAVDVSENGAGDQVAAEQTDVKTDVKTDVESDVETVLYEAKKPKVNKPKEPQEIDPNTISKLDLGNAVNAVQVDGR